MKRKDIARLLALMITLPVMLGVISCSSDDASDVPAPAVPGVEVCIIFAPNELGDQGYADRVLAGMHLFKQHLSVSDKERVELRYIAVSDTDAVRNELLRWNQQDTSPYTRRAYERRMLVLTDLSLLHFLAETPLCDTDEVLVMNVADSYFNHAPKADNLGPRFHLLNISAAEAARKFCKRIDCQTNTEAEQRREVWLLQGYGQDEVLADSISQAIDEYFGNDIFKRIYYTEILGTGNKAFNNAYTMGEAIRNGSYVVCNWASLNAALYANLYIQGTGDAEVIFVDTEIGNSAIYFPTIIRHYDQALCQWLERWLNAPPATMPQKEWHGAWDGYTTDNITIPNE